MSNRSKFIGSTNLTPGKYLIIFGTEVVSSLKGTGGISINTINSYSSTRGYYISSGNLNGEQISIIGTKIIKFNEAVTIYVWCKCTGENIGFYPYYNIVKLSY